MTDTTHDFGTADDGFHEIHLSGKQLVFFFMATTVVGIVIFLLGVMVGRGVPAQRGSADPLTADPMAVAAATPAASPAAAPNPPAAAPPVAADSAPVAAEPPPAAAETGELSYKKRLESESSIADSLKPRAAVPPPAPRPAPRTPEPAATSGSSAPPLVGTPRPGTWVVQVHSLRDRTVAAGIVQRLIAKDYPAFLVASGPPTGTYKVHVGRYRDREDAQRVVERLKKEEQFNSWITR